MSGRKKDPVWCSFLEIREDGKVKKAKCRKCYVEMANLVSRMKTHLTKCVGGEYIDIPT